MLRKDEFLTEAQTFNYVNINGDEATVNVNKGQFDKSISDSTKAIEINPKFAEAHSNRGNAYWGMGQYDKAISDYNKALEINPNFAMAYNNRGFVYFFKKEYEKAWDDVHKVQNLGYTVHPAFLRDLRQASGRQK